MRGVVIISAGFAEVGAERARRPNASSSRPARRNGMRIIGPNCLGVVNTAPDVRMNATFAPARPGRRQRRVLVAVGRARHRADEPGRRARASASPQFVSVGNKADVSGNDLLQYWADDPQTDVILLYLESFGNPRKFVRLARRVARTKPIVAVKSGRTAAGSRAASSHTAALASPDVAVDALFRQAGVIRVDTLDELLATAMVLAHQPLPAGRRVAIVSNAGGPGILAADACAGAGLEVPELDRGDAGRAARVRRASDASVAQPGRPRRGRDRGAVRGRAARRARRRGNRRGARHLRAAARDARADVAHAIVAPRPAMRTASRSCRASSAAPVFPMRSAATASGRTIPSFAFPESAAHALGRVADLADWRRRPTGAVPVFDDIDESTPGAWSTSN